MADTTDNMKERRKAFVRSAISILKFEGEKIPEEHMKKLQEYIETGEIEKSFPVGAIVKFIESGI